MEQEVSKLTHINKSQPVILLSCIKCYKDLFDVNLGKWTGTPIDTPLKDETNPYYVQDLTLPFIHLKYFEKDLDRLFTVGVPIKMNRSEWAAPSFNNPNNDSQFRFISDFRRLNKQVKHTPYPLLNIKYMISKISNFTFATTLDLIMG